MTDTRRLLPGFTSHCGSLLSLGCELSGRKYISAGAAVSPLRLSLGVSCPLAALTIHCPFRKRILFNAEVGTEKLLCFLSHQNRESSPEAGDLFLIFKELQYCFVSFCVFALPKELLLILDFQSVRNFTKSSWRSSAVSFPFFLMCAYLQI